MNVTHQVALLALQLGVILFATRLFGALAQKARIPSVIGELMAGIIIGPYLLGSLALPGYPHGLFPMPEAGSSIPVSMPLYALSTLGSIVLLFMSGLATDLRMFFRYSVAGTVVGIGGVIFSFIFGVWLGVILFHTTAMDPRCLFLGILATATSVGITARILAEKKAIDSPEGTTIMAAAVIDDVLGIICLAVVLGLTGAGSMDGDGVDWSNILRISVKAVGIWLVFTAAGLIGAHFYARMLKKFLPDGTFAPLAFAAAMLLAGIFEECGLAMIIGAYIAGLTLSNTDLSYAIQERLEGLYGFLVPVFFVVMGMMVDVSVFTNWETLKVGLIFSALAVIAKVVGCMLPALCLNFNMLGSLRIGAGMVPRGEVALIIAGIGATTYMTLDGKSVPVVDNKLFGIAIIMTLVTTLVAPPLLSMILSIGGKGVRKERPDSATTRLEFKMPTRTVRDFLVRQLVSNFTLEGFLHSNYAADYGMINFRKDKHSFIMTSDSTTIAFECSRSDVPMVKSIFNETTVELHKDMEALAHSSLPDANTRDVSLFEKIIPYTGENEMRLQDIIPENCAITDLQSDNYLDAIKELVRHLYRCGYVSDYDQCVKDIMAREQLSSTILEGGIAMPHAKTSTVKRIVSAVALPSCNREAGIPFRLIVMTISPMDTPSPYMQYIAHVASVLYSNDNLEPICKTTDPAELRKFFIS